MNRGMAGQEARATSPLANLPMRQEGPTRDAEFRRHSMSSQLAAFSNELAAVVKQVEGSVVAVHARPRFSSSGVIWKPGVIVTAEHTVRREEEITVTLPNGSTVPATLAGADAGTDIAVLRVEGAGGPGSPA